MIPDFVGDGETRREMAERALVGVGVATGEEGPEQPAPAAPKPPVGLPQGTGSSTADPDQPPPPDRLQEFERAAERALRSRHVPDVERAIVRRFFECLRAGGR